MLGTLDGFEACGRAQVDDVGAGAGLARDHADLRNGQRLGERRPAERPRLEIPAAAGAHGSLVEIDQVDVLAMNLRQAAGGGDRPERGIERALVHRLDDAVAGPPVGGEEMLERGNAERRQGRNFGDLVERVDAGVEGEIDDRVLLPPCHDVVENGQIGVERE